MAAAKRQADQIAEAMVSPLYKFELWAELSPADRKRLLKSLWAYYGKVPPKLMALFLEELAREITRRRKTPPSEPS